MHGSSHHTTTLHAPHQSCSRTLIRLEAYLLNPLWSSPYVVRDAHRILLQTQYYTAVRLLFLRKATVSQT